MTRAALARRWSTVRAMLGLLLMLVVTQAAAAGAQVTVAVSAPVAVLPRTPMIVRVEVTAPAAASVRMLPPAFAPFALVSSDRAPADTASRDGRQRLEWRFILRPPAGAGTYAFDPFEVDVQGAGLRAATFRSRAWSITVQAAPRPSPAAVAREELAGADPGRLAFDARVAPERVYVGEQTTLELRVGVGARVRERLRRSPEFAFPSVAGVVTYDLGARHGSTLAADLHIYRRALFPLAPGTIEIPAAQLTYALTPEDDPFGTEQRIIARSPPRRLLAVAPPIAGRPAGWGGAVGRFHATARVDTAHARVGDVVVYTLRVEGTGNVLLLPRPPLALPWADVAVGAERVEVDSTGDLAGGAKEFDWLLTPHAAADVRVPAVPYAYFDPRTSTYAFADAPSVTLRVAPGAANAVAQTPRQDVGPSARPRTTLGVSRAWGARAAPAAVAQREFWLGLAAVPAPGALWLLASASVARRRARRAGRPSTPGGASGGSGARARAMVELAEFRGELGALIGSPDARALDAPALGHTLRRAGLGAALARECIGAIEAWTREAFGIERVTVAPPADAMPEAPPSPSAARALLDRVARDLGQAARARGARAPALPVTAAPIWRLPRHMLAALTVSVAVLAMAAAAPRLTSGMPGDARLTEAERASAEAQARPPFDAGVAAYVAGDAGRARDLFVAAATAAPDIAVSWMNAGTAAWAADDTAGAAFAWHRAARLAPALPGLRDRLDRLPATAAAGRVGAPPRWDPRAVSTLALACAAITALWMLGAAVASPPAARWALGLYVATLAIAGAATYAMRATDARALAIVRAGGILHPEPALAASGAASVVTGEVARIVDHEGEWLHVQLDGARDGWLRAAQLAPLDGTP